MKKTRTLLLFVLFFAMPAMASSHTEPFIVNSLILSEILFVVSITGLTAGGGGYKILETRKKSLSSIFLIILLAPILYFSLVEISLMMLIIIGLSVCALVRALQMIIWGISAKRTNPPEYLNSAQPKDLFTAAALLTIVTVILCSFSVAAFQAGVLYRSHSMIWVRNFVCYQLAYGKIQHEETGKTRFDSIVISEPNPNMSVEVEYSDNLDAFTLYLAPKRFIPIWPYNYIFTIPVYHADQSGIVRRTYVTDIRQHCPADAQVYANHLPRGASYYYDEIKAGRCDIPEGFKRKSDD